MSPEEGASPQAILFDVDGVLIDSLSVKAEAFARAFDEFPAEHDRIIAFHHAHGGVNRIAKIEQIFHMTVGREPNPEELQERLDSFAQGVQASVIAAPEIAGAGAALRKWAAQCNLHAVSATPEAELIVILHKRGLASWLTGIHGFPPDKATMVASVLAKYGYQPHRCVMVGDSQEDLQAAQASGIPFIRVVSDSALPWSGTAAEIADLTTFDDAVHAALNPTLTQ